MKHSLQPHGSQTNPYNQSKQENPTPKPKQKGKGRLKQNPVENSTDINSDIGMSTEEISNIMRAYDSPQAMKENMARFIHTHAMKKMSNPVNTSLPQTANETPHSGTNAQNPQSYSINE